MGSLFRVRFPVALVILLAGNALPGQGLVVQDHDQWLDEDVAYIISDAEREVFGTLTTQEEREAFIEAFWRNRDPNPATPENEFQIEHYRRIDYANRFLGRESFLPGWKTDRGRIYIVLGEPKERQVFDGLNEIVSTEIWFYQGDVAKGLPSFFSLVFFKEHDLGDYELYHPVLDGPLALLRNQYRSFDDDVGAIERLYDISPELARVSLSLDPNDPGNMRTGEASIGADAILARIESYPARSIRTDYADAWLRYGRKVDVEYSFNYVPNRSGFAVLPGPEGSWFVHYSVELDSENFTMETDERRSRFYTTLDIGVEATKADGQLVEAFEREVAVELTPAEAERVGASPFAYQEAFPLIPGRFLVRVIVRNRVLTQYTVAEREVVVPALPDGSPRLGEIVLGYDLERLPASISAKSSAGAFQLDDERIYPAVDGTFAMGEEVRLGLSVVDARPGQQLEIRLEDGVELVERKYVALKESGATSVTETLPLGRLAGGEYRLTARLLGESGAGNALAETSTPLRVSPRTSIPRAGFVSRRSFDTSTDGLVDLAYGSQWLNLGASEDSRRALERAVAKNKDLHAARWGLAWIHIRAGEPERALALLKPLESSYPGQYEVVAGIGMGSYLTRNFDTAIRYLERALEIRPPDTMLLNMLGDSYARVGRTNDAKAMFERSLALRPQQSEIEERLAVLRDS